MWTRIGRRAALALAALAISTAALISVPDESAAASVLGPFTTRAKCDAVRIQVLKKGYRYAVCFQEDYLVGSYYFLKYG